MTVPQLIALSLAFLTLFIYFVIGARRRTEIKTLDDFLLYGRKLGVNGYEATFVATSISLATVLFFFLDFTGPLGLALLLSPVMYALGCYIFLRILPILKSNGYLEFGTTIHNFIAIAFQSNALRWISAGVSMLGYIGILVIEIHVGTTIFSVFSDHPLWPTLVVVFLLSLILVYTYMGGYRAVVDTDIVQLALIALGTIGALGALIALNLGSPPVNPIGTIEKLAPIPWFLPTAFIIVMVVGNVPFQMIRMSNWLRAAAVGDLDKVTQGLSRSIWYTFFSWIVFSVLGLLLFRLVTVEPGRGVLQLFDLLQAHGGFLSLVIFPLMFVACLAALISTADSVFLPILAAWIYDFRFTRRLHNEDGTAVVVTDPNEQATMLKAARNSILAFLLIGWCLYLLLKVYLQFRFVDLLFVFFNQQLVLFPAVVIALIGSRSPSAAHACSQLRVPVTIGMISGWIAAWGVSIYGTTSGNPDLVLYSAALGLATSTLLTVLLAPHKIVNLLRSR